jgi:hypothetical protein
MRLHIPQHTSTASTKCLKMQVLEHRLFRCSSPYGLRCKRSRVQIPAARPKTPFAGTPASFPTPYHSPCSGLLGSSSSQEALGQHVQGDDHLKYSASRIGSRRALSKVRRSSSISISTAGGGASSTHWPSSSRNLRVSGSPSTSLIERFWRCVRSSLPRRVVRPISTRFAAR